MKQMKEDQQRRRMVDAKRNREIAQLKKEQRRQEVSLQLQLHCKPDTRVPINMFHTYFIFHLVFKVPYVTGTDKIEQCYIYCI